MDADAPLLNDDDLIGADVALGAIFRRGLNDKLMGAGCYFGGVDRCLPAGSPGVRFIRKCRSNIWTNKTKLRRDYIHAIDINIDSGNSILAGRPAHK